MGKVEGDQKSSENEITRKRPGVAPRQRWPQRFREKMSCSKKKMRRRN